MLPPDDVVEEESEDNGRENNQNTEEGIQTSSKAQDEESVQGSNETDTTVAGTEEK